MTAHVMCFTSSGGIPIFIRKKGEGSPMAFSKMASLSGIHMFLKSQDIKLNDTKMSDIIVSWNEYADSVTLIAIASGVTKKILDYFIEAVFNAMILVVGIDEIKNPRNIERLKKDLRACYGLIDKLFECLEIDDRFSTKNDLIDLTSSMLCPENHLLQNGLEMFLEYLDSSYGCILVHGCCTVATESWWQLDSIEKKLLSIVISMDRNASSCDLPVFLPKMSPTIAFRLLSITLVNGVHVLALCGPKPDLIEVEKLAIQCWRNHIDVLRRAEHCYPQCIPSEISLDPDVLGFLLINYRVGKFVMSRNIKQTTNHQTNLYKLDILRTFYYQAVETFLLTESNKKQEKEKNSNKKKTIRTKETYWCLEYYKCHALKAKSNILCVLYTYSIPIDKIRLITRKTLKLLVSDKQLCW
ncbi:protein fuzzy homolog [Chelonus insularis]|uniref:protein fuzzy homolog n=1 Tax=Chelonus insularis TaxID=460826 RepID=UPI00158A519E|nr:protein fuzzy homolog [Chelonus insularis]